MVVVSALVGIYYNMIIGWAIYYLIASFVNLPSNDLVWNSCVKGDASPCEYRWSYDEGDERGFSQTSPLLARKPDNLFQFNPISVRFL